MPKPKVLIIEDDRPLAEVVAYNLKQAGYEVLLAHDAVLEAGSMPVEMVRASLIRQSLPGDYRTSWKFLAALR